MSEMTLPVGTEHWPTQPGRRDGELRRVDSSAQCRAYRNGWYCTRDRDHRLPHVAHGGDSVIAVWDQLWYRDIDHSATYRTRDVRVRQRTDLDAIRSA